MVFFSRKRKVLETRLTIEDNSCGMNTLHLNILRRISISETLAPRTGNSFLRSENSFQRVMKKTVLLERMLNCNFRNSCYKSREFFSQLKRILVRNENSFQQAVMQRVLLEIANLTNRIEISETLATRIRNSFSQERGFFLAGKEVEGSSGENV